MALRVAPLASLFSITVAPDTTAPLGSVTVPVRSPETSDCAIKRRRHHRGNHQHSQHSDDQFLCCHISPQIPSHRIVLCRLLNPATPFSTFNCSGPPIPQASCKAPAQVRVGSWGYSARKLPYSRPLLIQVTSSEHSQMKESVSDWETTVSYISQIGCLLISTFLKSFHLGQSFISKTCSLYLLLRMERIYIYSIAGA